MRPRRQSTPRSPRPQSRDERVHREGDRVPAGAAARPPGDIGRDGSPHVVPVGFRLDPDAEAINVGGHRLSDSKKWRDLQADPHVAFVVDDLRSVDPWTPRGLEIRGQAELHEAGGESFGSGWDTARIRSLPRRVVIWGIEGPRFLTAPSA
jgi:pyridoxamine 5'-phosphate oxidase family protein